MTDCLLSSDWSVGIWLMANVDFKVAFQSNICPIHCKAEKGFGVISYQGHGGLKLNPANSRLKVEKHPEHFATIVAYLESDFCQVQTT